VIEALRRHLSPASMRGSLLRLVLVVLIPLLLVQAGIYAAWYYSRWNEQEMATRDTACEAAATFATYVHDVRRQESAIGMALTGPHKYSTQETNDFLRTAGQDYPSVDSWSWISPEGKLLASTRPHVVGVSLGDRDYFQALREGRPWTVSNLLTDRLSGERRFVIASRISDRNGTMLGAVVAVLKAADLGERAVALYHPAGEALALFDREGTLVYNSQEQRHVFQDWRGEDPVLVEALKSNSPQLGVLRLSNDGERTEQYIAARVPVDDIGWVAGARRSVPKAMASVRTGLWIVTGLNVLVVVISGLLAVRTSKSLIRQLRRLQGFAQAVGQGDFGHTVEAGRLRELAELATAFNQMSTAVSAAQSALQRTADQLASSNQELEQFAYIASHDLQEPLRVVIGYVQLIERKYKGHLDADADQFFHYIVEGVARMQQLINDLLNYSRVGTRGLALKETSLDTVLDRALANLKLVIDETGATVTHDALPKVQADETQLVQLFQNLIGNGIKFRSDHPPAIHVSARRDSDHWVLGVRDNGIGIEPAYWEQIFVIFQRLHTRQKYAGTGIGLAICKRIVERHGGRIWLESQLGQGATFYFTLF
jgi:signal transduction histidine kinase